MKGFFIIGIMALLAGCMPVGYNGQTSSRESNTTESSLSNPAPKFSSSGTQLIMVNEDEYNYTNAEIEINGKYSYKTGEVIKPGETYAIGLMQFASSDGTRFNPFQLKIKSINISCDEGFSHFESVH